MTTISRRDDPRLLILETSGRVGQVAVAEGRRLGQTLTLSESRRHARDLAPAIAELCGSRGWKVRDLDAVIVSLGPGSYTGLRIGIMSAKTLAYASGCAILGIESFAAIARRAPQEAEVLDVIADAQQQNVYVQHWRREAEGWIGDSLRIRTINEWLADRNPEIWVTGPGVAAYEAKIPAVTPRVPVLQRDPDPLGLLELGLVRWQKEDADDLWTLEPLYLRPSSAEQNWDRTGPRRSRD
jgi:tRNA threonylcarbamoyladenosine biosynthesis protein TsaB